VTLRAILFDFDGTLADSFDAIIWSTNHVRVLNGLPELPPDDIRCKIGWGLPHLMSVIAPHVPVDTAVAQYREHHATVMEKGTRLFPGVIETLTTLQKQNYRMGVCSNKAVHFTREIIGILKISHFFECIMGPEDVGGNPKPAPDMLHAAMKCLNVATDEVLYIGDMIIDVQTARAAGVPVWVIPSGTQTEQTLLAEKPDRLLPTFPDLLSALPQELRQ